jgi:hypothetical protein
MSSQGDHGWRIAASSSEAAAGYATATVAAYVDFAGQMLGFWAQAMDNMIGAPTPKSWYRHPDDGKRASPAFNPLAMLPWAHGSTQSFPMFQAAGPIPMFNPVAFWMNAWPPQGNPAAWPMAFAMMGMGVSRSVAYPLADANTAAIDVIKSVGDVVEENFARYRSDGGHASAQVRISFDKVLAGFMPVGFGALMPWMMAMQALPRSV